MSALPAEIEDLDAITPWQLHEGVWIKRDDLFELEGIRGGKIRTCAALARGAAGLTTASFRDSPQSVIVAAVARRLGIPARIHCPDAKNLGSELMAVERYDGELVRHRPGYGSVITARAQQDAAERGWKYIPFGMECEEAVEQTAGQIRAGELPDIRGNLVVPIGSGMSAAGVIAGLWNAGILDLPVLGVQVGAAGAERRLDSYAPMWRQMRVELVQSGLDYHKPYPNPWLGKVQLDSIYEAKCLPYLWRGDALWAVGRRLTDVEGA